MKPLDIQVDLKQSQLRITWADGHISQLPFNLLRQKCPCATCEQVRQDDDPLRILTPDQAVTEGVLRPQNPVEMVGLYALQFFWADGHSTGIYSFSYLRQLGS